MRVEKKGATFVEGREEFHTEKKKKKTEPHVSIWKADEHLSSRQLN